MTSNNAVGKARTFVQNKPSWLMKPFAFQTLANVAPGIAALWAERLFFTPPRTHASNGSRELLVHAEKFTIKARGERVQCLSWGSGPIVILVHGWGGNWSNLRTFVEPLVQSNFQVVTFDAPGHGESSGKMSSIIHFNAALKALVERIGPARGIIAHSLGATASAYALHNGLEVERAAFLGAAAEPLRYFRRFLAWIGAPGSLGRIAEENIENHLNTRFPDLSVPTYAPQMATPLLVVHDTDDAEVPYADGTLIAAKWPGARLLTTNGLGHRGILREKQVIENAVTFVTNRRFG